MTENNAQVAVKDEAPAAGFGKMLRQIRENAGLSLDDLVSRTKISRNQLEALEAETMRLLPEPVYVRAFIRDICRVTETDPKPVIEAYMKAYAPASSSGTPADLVHSSPVPEHGLRKDVEFHASARKRGLRVLIAFAVVVVLALLAWAGWGHDLVEKFGGSDIEAVKVTQNEGSNIAALQRPRSPSNALPASAPASALADQAAEAARESQGAASDSAQSPAAQAPAAGEKAAAAAQSGAAPGQGVVQIRTIGASWVKLVDADGRVLVQAEMKAGEERSFTGRLPIRATVGNTGSCAVSLNGEPVDLSAYSKGSVARFVMN
ncbi:helix-turn-helix domain-containing protein [Mesosutterella sp. AGMB02718]|uniref:Helix-turn-helix domain-containing protein n=1 Tax=Mesosutterella faecium TaxID=2925194 RepID=A0ABT7ILJ3_9BURK|nr:helix-turn-helix domain-containing protein [Mesosutterella sp. AGMB02718]MDL2059231.1 helix-turn-helix domain-containing protein [Mesosutterella sp. AGMB02718]